MAGEDKGGEDLGERRREKGRRRTPKK